MAKWVSGQSGNPKGRPLRGRSVAELARAIAAEKVGFEDGEERVVLTRLERMLRVLFTMALDGDMRAVRCLLEYMEGRPVQLVAATVVAEGERPLTADQLRSMLSDALARVEEWRRESGTAPVGTEGTGSLQENG